MRAIGAFRAPRPRALCDGGGKVPNAVPDGRCCRPSGVKPRMVKCSRRSHSDGSSKVAGINEPQLFWITGS